MKLTPKQFYHPRDSTLQCYYPIGVISIPAQMIKWVKGYS